MLKMERFMVRAIGAERGMRGAARSSAERGESRSGVGVGAPRKADTAQK